MAQPARLVAPVTCLAGAQALLAAGADELYCGALPPSWSSLYGDAALLNRRQGRAANVEQLATLRAVAGRTALAVNLRYTRDQLPAVRALVEDWAAAGGRAVIVSDLGLLRELAGTGLRLHLSSLAGVFNAEAAWFFADWGVQRIILPRDLSLADLGALVCGGPPVEWEVIVMHQKCRFMDGFCGFHHDVALPAGVPAAFEYQYDEHGTPITWADDPAYEGHGCQMVVAAPADWGLGHCGACALGPLSRLGITHFKLAGRGYPAGETVRAVRFLRQAADRDEAPAAVAQRYAELFGRPCEAAACYFPEVRDG